MITKAINFLHIDLKYKEAIIDHWEIERPEKDDDDPSKLHHANQREIDASIICF